MYILLKPLLSKIKCYVKDDFDFLKKCKRNLTENSKLVSFDVTSLYINMPHELELKAIEYWLGEYPESIHSRFNKSFILEALKLFLKNNNLFLTKNSFFKLPEPLWVLLLLQHMRRQ